MMILRSSSTPHLRSLLSSLSESPQKHPTTPNIIHHNCSNISVGKWNGLRRVQSDGNLEESGNTSHKLDDFILSKKFTFLEEEEEEKELEVDGNCYPFSVQDLAIYHEGVRRNVDSGVPAAGGGGCGRGGSYRPVDSDGDGGGGGVSMEEHYKRMLEQNPDNPLLLRNYAHFLHQEKGDHKGAEEYYSRAILGDPEDGEVLCEYAKLIWEIYHDKERAEAYFERAVQASSQDSHINASYASFLWDAEDDEDEDAAYENSHLSHHTIMASATS